MGKLDILIRPPTHHAWEVKRRQNFWYAGWCWPSVDQRYNFYFDKIFWKKLDISIWPTTHHTWEVKCRQKFWYAGWCWLFVDQKNHMLTKFIFLMKFCTFWYVGWYWPCVDLVLTFCWLMLTKIICWLNFLKMMKNFIFS